MKIRVITILAMAFYHAALFAQMSIRGDYEKVLYSPAMKWICPEIEKYQDLFYSLRNEDYKIYANNVKEKIELFSDPKSPNDKFIVTQTQFTIENPVYNTQNLLNHIATWVKKYKGWGNTPSVDIVNKKITSTSAKIIVASNSSFLSVNKVSISPTLTILLVDENKLIISFVEDYFLNDEYSGRDNRYSGTLNAKISEVYPFVQKSSYKNSYAKAYVGTYLFFWNFISDLRKELNTNFSRDNKMLAQLHYEYSNDSLRTRYGEPTKVIADQLAAPDVNRELRFYENAQKLVFMGKTIDFKDIISCEIIDDPQFIPGRTVTAGGGIFIFGFGLGGAETSRTPDKTIHNYVVDIEIDNLATPFIRIATGQNEVKAREISSAFEYIMRHQQSPKVTGAKKSRIVTRGGRR